ncbi:RGSL protein, partial [Ptilonorhynchus violaceus]|nr:RGSL protein [Ptilonorhynchus violaceus]
RMLDKRVIVVNFLVNDLRFYLEMDRQEQDPTCLCRFCRMTETMEGLATRNRWSEKHITFLKKKLDIISRLFLNSDIPPKLRVRPWD